MVRGERPRLLRTPTGIEAASEAWIAGTRLQKNRIYTRPAVVAPSWSGSGVPSKPAFEQTAGKFGERARPSSSVIRGPQPRSDPSTPHALPFPSHRAQPVPRSVHDASSSAPSATSAVKNAETFENAFGRRTRRMIRGGLARRSLGVGGRPRLHPIPFVSLGVHSWLVRIRVDPCPSVVAASRSGSETPLDPKCGGAAPGRRGPQSGRSRTVSES